MEKGWMDIQYMGLRYDYWYPKGKTLESDNPHKKYILGLLESTYEKQSLKTFKRKYQRMPL